MKPLSIDVDTAWKLALWEASANNSEFIEKEHAVIGLLSLEKVAAGKFTSQIRFSTSRTLRGRNVNF